MKHIRHTASAFTVFCILVQLSMPTVVLAAEQDTDGDGITDIREDANGNSFVDAGETDPYKADTDGGGESDGSEFTNNRKPLDKTDDATFDADGDGWVNGIEWTRGTDANDADSDNDGTNDSLDPFPMDVRYREDANANGLPDEWERSTGLDKPGMENGAQADADKDGLTNAQEFAQGLNPSEGDTDHDGTTDFDELLQKTDPKENPCLEYGTFSEPFADMKGHWAQGYVFRLQETTVQPDDMPIVRGYVNAADRLTSFSPDTPVTRFEFLKMVLLSTCTTLTNDSLSVPVRFDDVPSIPPQQEEDPDVRLRRQVVYTAVRYGIVQGYPDGTWRPDALINRAEALKILALASQLPQSIDTTPATLFADVKATDWFAPYVRLAVGQDIVSGYADGTFQPERSITRAEAAKIIYKTMLVNPYINGYVLPRISEE